MIVNLFEQYLKALTGQDFLFVFISVFIGFVSGFLFERVILKLISKILSFIPKKIGDSISHSLKFMPIFWGIILGLYFSLKHIGMGPKMTFAVREILIVCATLSIGFVISRFFAARIKYKAQESDSVIVSTSIFGNIIKVLILFISILVALRILNVPIGPALTALGVGGIAVALALKDTLENFFGGLQIIFSKQVRIGNYIMLTTGEEGFVRDITWRNTSIETPYNTTLIIPNSKLSSAYVTNCSVPDESTISRIKFIVSAYANVNTVEEITINIANKIQDSSIYKSSHEYKPFVHLRDLGQFGQEWWVYLLTDHAENINRIRHEFLKELIFELQNQKIELFPVGEDRKYQESRQPLA